jgi:hypothetical protein
MLLLLIPQGAGAGLEVQLALNDVVYRLGFTGPAELNATSWVTAAELFQFADDAAKKLAYDSGLFLTYDSSITATAGTAVYSLPATHVFTLAAWLAAQPLRLTSVRDLWALDSNWPTTSGDSVRASLDAGSVGTITLYPIPVAGGTLAQVAQEFAPTIQAGASTIALPPILRDYFSYAMLAGARGKESDLAMPEMAQHYQQRMALFEQIMREYWGPGQ